MSAATCPFEEEVLLLGDGELDFTRRVVVEAHLGLCASCAEIEDTLSRVEEYLVGLPDESLDAVEAALERLPPPRRSPVPLLLAGLAAAAGIAWLLVDGRSDEPLPEGPAEAPKIARDETPERAPEDALNDVPKQAPEKTHVAREDEPELPYLPPPRPREGPSLRRALLALDPASDQYEDSLDVVAGRVRNGGSRSASALARLLASDEPDVASRAMDVAELTPSLALERALATVLDQPDLRPRAMRLLGDLRAAGSVPALAAQLDGPARDGARNALASIGTAAAARALGDRVWSAPEKERAVWLDATVTASPRRGAWLLLGAVETEGFEDAVRATLSRHRDALLPHLRDLAGGRDVLRARPAMRLLGWSRDGLAVPALAEMSRAPKTAYAATRALVDIGSPEAVAAALAAVRRAGAESPVAAAIDGAAAVERALIARLRDGDVSQQEFAVRLLWRCGGDAAAVALEPAGVPRALHPMAIATLARIGGDEAARSLALYVDERPLRRVLVGALGATRSPEALPALRLLAREPRLAADVAAALALIETEESVELLLALLTDSDASEEAGKSLAALPAGLAVPVLLERYREEPIPRVVRRTLIARAGRDLGPSSGPWRGWWEARP